MIKFEFLKIEGISNRILLRVSDRDSKMLSSNSRMRVLIEKYRRRIGFLVSNDLGVPFTKATIDFFMLCDGELYSYTQRYIMYWGFDGQCEYTSAIKDGPVKYEKVTDESTKAAIINSIPNIIEVMEDVGKDKDKILFKGTNYSMIINLRNYKRYDNRGNAIKITYNKKFIIGDNQNNSVMLSTIKIDNEREVLLLVDRPKAAITTDGLLSNDAITNYFDRALDKIKKLIKDKRLYADHDYKVQLYFINDNYVVSRYEKQLKNKYIAGISAMLEYSYHRNRVIEKFILDHDDFVINCNDINLEDTTVDSTRSYSLSIGMVNERFDIIGDVPYCYSDECKKLNNIKILERTKEIDRYLWKKKIYNEGEKACC